MALNLAQKKTSFMNRLLRDIDAVVDAIRVARMTAGEYTAEAFDGGDLVNRAAYQITDADLTSLGFPHLSATTLNQFIGGFNAVKTAYDSNQGVIDAGRP